MPKVFISHSNQDIDKTLLIVASLKHAGFDVWVDFENIRGGADWLCEIQAGIERCDAVVTVLSKMSLQSLWVERECLYAFQLKKPLLTALIDDLRLPLHLINIQYCDCREQFADGISQLVKSLRNTLTSRDASLNYGSDEVSIQPKESNFFPYIAQLPRGETAMLIAQDLFHWASLIADELVFGGKTQPGFHARINLKRQQLTVFSIWAYPKTPSLQVPFDYLAQHKPYSSRRMRRSALKRLNQLLPADIRFALDKADRRPTLPLHVLSTAEKLEAFKHFTGEIIDNLRGEP